MSEKPLAEPGEEEVFPLSYCPGGSETLARLSELFVERSPRRICATFDFQTQALQQFARTHSAVTEYPNPHERAHFWNAHLSERRALCDDSVPSAYLTEFDQGLYGGMLGGEVRFLADSATGWISSMVPPLFEDITQADNLTVAPDSPWFDRFCRQIDIFAEQGAGRFGISHLILIDSLNFLFELVGATASYMAMIEDPGRVRRAIDFAYDLNVRVHEAFFERAGLVAGGTCSNMVGWLPGRVLNESVDPFHMTSVDDFERWGREPAERIFQHFDGGVVHIHGNGRHLLGAVSRMKGLHAIYLGDDRGYAPAFFMLEEIRELCGSMPLVARAEFRDFAEALTEGRLPGGVLYHVRGAPDIDSANRLMDRVRRYVPGA